MLPNGLTAGQTLVAAWEMLHQLTDEPMAGPYTMPDLVRVIAAGVAGKTTITPTAANEADVVFRSIDDAKDVIDAHMVGSERTDIAIDATGP